MTDTNNNKRYINVTEKGVAMLTDGKLLTIGADHPSIGMVKQAIRDKDFEKAAQLMNPERAVRIWINGAEDPDFVVEDMIVTYRGKPYSAEISEKVLRMIRENLDASPLLAFLRRLQANPSATAQREALLFCDANKFFIDEEGYIIAFKGVREDYFDKHSGTILNTVGNIVEMPRNEVDDRREMTCSFGLHFASYEFAKDFGSRTMMLRVDPADIVSIPNDYHNQKGRCCKYEVVGELERAQLPPQKEVYTPADFAGTSIGTATLAEEDSEYPKSDWQLAVTSGDTTLGYEEWVQSKREEDDFDDLDDHDDDDPTETRIQREAELESGLIQPLREALGEGRITTRQQFEAFVVEKGESLDDDDVIHTLFDAGLDSWLKVEPVVEEVPNEHEVKVAAISDYIGRLKDALRDGSVTFYGEFEAFAKEDDIDLTDPDVIEAIHAAGLGAWLK
jgi:hypothetical protein